MRILVTGSSGFIGTSLCPALREAGHEVSEFRRFRGTNYHEREAICWGDIRQLSDVQRAVEQASPELILHLAAITAVTYSFPHSEEVWQTIVEGTRNVMLVAVAYGVRVISASSSEVYGVYNPAQNGHGLPLREDAQIMALSPYSAAKINAEGIVTTLGKRMSVPPVILRPFNTVGRARVGNSHYVVEKAIAQALTLGVINLHEHSATRDFLWREDHVAGYLAALPWKEGGIFNLCTGYGITIAAMAEMVAAIHQHDTGHTVSISFQGSDRPRDIPYLVGDPSKAQQLLGWKAQVPVAKALQLAYDEWKARILNLLDVKG